MSIKVLFEDNHILVINKPAGLLTQPSGKTDPSAESFAKEYLKEKYQKPGNVFLEAIHRLDKPVKGIVVFAKTSKALSRLQKTIRERQCKKIYWAWVEGSIDKPGSLKDWILHKDFYATLVSEGSPHAKKAILSYIPLEQKDGNTLIEIALETGRYHQIRVQMASIGHPIVGDKKYGSNTSYKEGSIALEHKRMSLPHPITQEVITFDSDGEYL